MACASSAISTSMLSNLSARAIKRSAPPAASTTERVALRGKRSQRMCICMSAAAPAGSLKASNVDVLGDRILIRKDEDTNVTSGGLLLSAGDSKANEEYTCGEVVSVGDDVKIDGLTSGVKLLVKGYGGTPVKIEDETLHFIRDDDVMGILE
mmetsp:Transcript_7762/g.14641  ORF Transcript_7762/g.14641 Transcript_7762/m.14641 type:complete len:152 (-) Transcript_7762:245-700(-)|eukprot:CAMPEP_0114226930 /NCGR_PEP_ID=MMETSP0058-20121206/1508_1 /TAXON_ID=36894 /ORGANISM="Pyramimonas parkeae, CCMP726" /LENGTH=151 /DNA_ID=CAMNT_0001337715 /DNA_START=105 /DNA_END=560 /DNA_ORIENTATION=-